MSEMAVLVIRIRKQQAAEYERLFEENELPRWRDYTQRGVFKSARIFRSAFGSHEGDVHEPETPNVASLSRVMIGEAPALRRSVTSLIRKMNEGQ